MDMVVLDPDPYSPSVICFVQSKITDTQQLTLARGIWISEGPAVTPQWTLSRRPWSPVVTYDQNTVNSLIRNGTADLLVPDWPPGNQLQGIS